MRRLLYVAVSIPLVVIFCAPIAIEVSIYEVCRRVRSASWVALTAVLLLLVSCNTQRTAPPAPVCQEVSEDGLSCLLFGPAREAPPPELEDHWAVRAKAAAELSLRDVHLHSGMDALFVDYRGCSTNDSIMYGADGLNASDHRVNVIVCCGLMFRGCTVRIP